MARNRELEALITLAGKLDPSLQKALKQAEKEINALARGSGNAGDEFAKLEKKAIKNIESIDKRLIKAGKSIEKFGKVMTVALTVPIVAMGKQAITAFTGFDDAMRGVEAAMSPTSSELERLRQAALTMGTDTEHSATKAAESLRTMGQAGYDAAQALTVLPDVMNIAVAGGMGIDETTSMLMDSMNVIGAGAEEAKRFGDQVSIAADLVNASMGDMFNMMTGAGTAQRALAGGSSEALALAAGMVHAGKVGEEGGTALRRFFQNMTENAGALKEYGIDVYNDADQSLNSYLDTLASLGNVLNGLSTKDKDDLFTALGFDEASKSQIESMATDAANGALHAFANTIYNSDGAAKSKAEIMGGGIGGAIRSMESSLETLSISFGDTLAPKVQAFADAVGDVANNFANMPPEQKSFMTDVALAGLALGPAAFVVGKVAGGVGTVIKGLGEIVAGEAIITPALEALGAAILSPAGGIVLFAAGVAGMSIAIDKMATDTLNDRVAERFGDVALSLKDIQEITQSLETPFVNTVKGINEEAETLRGAYDELLTLDSELQKKLFTASFTDKLTGEQEAALLSQVQGLVTQAQEAIDKESHVVTATLTASFGLEETPPEVSAIVDAFGTYYAEAKTELAKAGTDLQQSLYDALLDDTITPKEREQITAAQQKLMKITQELAAYESEVAFYRYDEELKASDLTLGSLEGIAQEIASRLDTDLNAIQQNKLDMRALLRSGLEKGTISKSQYDAGLLAEEERYGVQEREQIEKAARLSATAVMSATDDIYSEKLSQLPEWITGNTSDVLFRAMEELADDFGRTLTTGDLSNPDIAYAVQDQAMAMLKEMRDTVMPDPYAQEEVIAAYETLVNEGFVDTLNAAADYYREAGQPLPEYLNDVLLSINKLGALGGAEDYLSRVTAGSEMLEQQGEPSWMKAYTDDESAATRAKRRADEEEMFRKAIDETSNALSNAAGDFDAFNAALGRLRFPTIPSSTQSGPTIQAYADGGTAYGPTFGLFAEDGVPETFIPHKDTPRTRGLLTEAAQGVLGKNAFAGSDSGGSGSGITFVYHQEIHIYPGSSSAETTEAVMKGARDAKDWLERQVREMRLREERESFGQL